jgi:hypothetical protein
MMRPKHQWPIFYAEMMADGNVSSLMDVFSTVEAELAQMRGIQVAKAAAAQIQELTETIVKVCAYWI